MSGETEERESAWTVDTIRAHFEAVLAERDLRYQQRFDAQEKALDAALASAEKQVNQALTSAQQAVDKAEAAAERRFASVNEFRAQLGDQVRTFAPREYVDSQLQAVSQRLVDLADARQAALDEARRLASALLPREVFDTAIASSMTDRAALRESIGKLESRIDVAASQQAGGQAKVTDQRATLAAWIGASTLVLAVVIFLANFLTAKSG
jgi:hypothetical protein